MKRATYYYHVKERIDKYEGIRKQIRLVYDTNKGRYGYRRVWLTLRAKGEIISRKVVARLMREIGLKARQRRVHYHSFRGVVGKVVPNILNRQFTADGPYQKWSTDVTQVDIKGKKCYLSPILDMWNGEVISYCVSDSPNLKMVTTMLKRACKKHPDIKPLILHSDQGWHYQHKIYQALLDKYHITQSMSRKGNCLDNAMMENFFGLMKKELLYINQFVDIADFKKQLKEYIDYYNRKRIKLRLGMSPTQYRLRQNTIN
jgi:putative transposase